MRISGDTRFPRPVLSRETGDFKVGEFDVTFTCQESKDTGAITLLHEATLTEPAIRELVSSNKAAIGCFVTCDETYYTELRELSWPKGRSDFQPGSLLNRVSLLPVIWARETLGAWTPGTVHPEFESPYSYAKGDIIALGTGYPISVGRARYAPLESIFELRSSADVPEGRLRVNPNGDRIGIDVAPGTFRAIELLRGRANGHQVVMNAVYLPAVMEVLNILRLSGEQYEDRRWLVAFRTKCDAKRIPIGGDASTFLEDAQTLLENPIQLLSSFGHEVEQ